MTTDESQEEPKLIVDEDWKTQVQREKDELKKKQAAEAAARTAEDSDSEGEEPAAQQPPEATEAASSEAESSEVGPAGTEEEQPKDDASALPPPPPANLPLLITTLATQAMSALGQLPDADGQPSSVNLPYAKHFIDLIAVLEAKTQGNLEKDEQAYLNDALHQLRMAYVTVSNRHKST